jgi:hypothetical protein
MIRARQGDRGGVVLHPQERCLDTAGQQAGRQRCAAKGGMTQGWTGSLDKLEAFLSNHCYAPNII